MSTITSADTKVIGLTEFNSIMKKIERISAKSLSIFIIDNEHSIEVYSKNTNLKIVPGSVVKLLTLFLVFDLNISLREIVRVKENNLIVGSGYNLQENDLITINDLLKNMIFKSSNTSAEVLKEIIEEKTKIPYEEHAKKIINKLGMTLTNIVNSHGLYERKQYTTVDDLLKLVINMLENKKIESFLFYSHQNIIIQRNKNYINIDFDSNEKIFIKTGTLFPNVFNSLQIVKIRNNYLVACLGYSKNDQCRLIDQEVINNLIGVI
ncbi:serine hydrolase [Acinetobacter seifertii]|uniref:serine hydrolase n=1 Tax=Acinetobacter seifertii TaxID=1530123 RepID=UPI00168D7371|nr:serine hydrolase [Acinetobacter seifertii]QNX01286.1 serine hydrolase [Acinetobacter seifertii]